MFPFLRELGGAPRKICPCTLTYSPVLQGVTRPKGCRMSIIEAVWQGEDNASKAADEVEEQKA